MALAHEIEYYPGIFRDCFGKLHDLRPNDVTIGGVRYLRPSLNNFNSMSKQELATLLQKALEVQLEELQSSKHEAHDANYESKTLVSEL